MQIPTKCLQRTMNENVIFGEDLPGANICSELVFVFGVSILVLGLLSKLGTYFVNTWHFRRRAISFK